MEASSYFKLIEIVRISPKVHTVYLTELSQQQYVTHKDVIFQHINPAFQYTWCSSAQVYVWH
jgi:hypothetical protein